MLRVMTMDKWTPVKIAAALILGVTLYVAKTIYADAARQPPQRRITTRTVPMLASDLKPGMVITTQDIGMGPWPANEIQGDVLLGTQFIVGRVVKKEIKSAYPIHASSLYRAGEYSKEYIGVP